MLSAPYPHVKSFLRFFRFFLIYCQATARKDLLSTLWKTKNAFKKLFFISWGGNLPDYCLTKERVELVIVKLSQAVPLQEPVSTLSEIVALIATFQESHDELVLLFPTPKVSVLALRLPEKVPDSPLDSLQDPDTELPDCVKTSV
jgi:hypothetical protein